MSSRLVSSARMSNCRCTQLDQLCSRHASWCGAPSTVAIVSDGYGRATAATKSHPLSAVT